MAKAGSSPGRSALDEKDILAFLAMYKTWKECSRPCHGVDETAFSDRRLRSL